MAESTALVVKSEARSVTYDRARYREMVLKRGTIDIHATYADVAASAAVADEMEEEEGGDGAGVELGEDATAELSVALKATRLLDCYGDAGAEAEGDYVEGED